MDWRNFLKSRRKLESVNPVVNCYPVIMVSVLIVTWRKLEIENRNIDGMMLTALSDN